MSDTKLILGVDPGSQNAGFALLETRARRFQVIRSGVCQLDPKMDFFKRLSQLSLFFKELVEPLGAFDLAVESLAYVKNVNSFGKLAQARGAILSATQPMASCVAEYPPNLVKSTVSGYGHASKGNIEKSLGFTLTKKQFQTHDESDALAIALCHHFQQGRTPRVSAKKSRTIKEAMKGRKL